MVHECRMSVFVLLIDILLTILCIVIINRYPYRYKIKRNYKYLFLEAIEKKPMRVNI